MIAVPALDLRDGACVQLVGGRYDQERVRLPDPLAVARDWAARGFSRLHVVDLDAATGHGSNRATVEALIAQRSARTQVGGGVRDDRMADALLAAGAERVVVGTRAIEEPEWLVALAFRHPGRVVVAADVHGRQIVKRGWAVGAGMGVFIFALQSSRLPLAGLLVTAVHREGRMAGPDVDLMRLVVERTAVPVIASGGITSCEDLRRLRDVGVAEAVLGMALYTGVLDSRATAKEFGS